MLHPRIYVGAYRTFRPVVQCLLGSISHKYTKRKGACLEAPFRLFTLCLPANARHLIVVNDNVPAAKLSIYCLVNGVCFGVCALPYPDGELIRLASRLITILG